MAKRGTLDHPKNKRLARALKTIPAFTLGLLESLWHKVTQFHWNGKVTRLDLEEVFDSVGLLTIYTTDQLIEALTNPNWRWLDPLEDGTWYVHGWHEHCEDSVHAKLYRSAQTFGNGAKPIPKKIGKNELEELEKAWKTQPAAVAPLPAADGSQNPPHGDRRQPALPSQAKPSQALKIAHTPPAMKNEFPGPLRTKGFEEAWGMWESYRVESGHGVVQPITRIQVLSDLAKLGPQEAENKVRLAIKRQWKHIHIDAKEVHDDTSGTGKRSTNGANTRRSVPGGDSFGDASRYDGSRVKVFRHDDKHSNEQPAIPPSQPASPSG